MLNISICHQCKHRGPVTDGACPCLADPEKRDIVEHAEYTGCPEGKFPKSDKPRPEPRPTRMSPARTAAHAAAGIVKAVVGTGGASEELVKQRTAICGGCEHAILSLGVLSRCKLCGCATWAKVRNADEKCPVGKW